MREWASKRYKLTSGVIYLADFHTGEVMEGPKEHLGLRVIQSKRRRLLLNPEGTDLGAIKSVSLMSVPVHTTRTVSIDLARRATVKRSLKRSPR